MRVFMLGWEFPPFISGGLGVACYGLTRALGEIGADVLFILPRPTSTPFSTHVQFLSASAGPQQAAYRLDGFDHVTFRSVDANLTNPYATAGQYAEQSHFPGPPGPSIEHSEARSPAATAASAAEVSAGAVLYGSDLFAEVARYAEMATEIARQETFDVVHAHDWMTFPAGLAVAAARNVPLVVHVHSTEFDRAGPSMDQRIYDLERRGMHGAMKVIAVSALTRSQIVHRYGISAEKIEVVYNAVDANGEAFAPEHRDIGKDEKVVLFLGRITHQKGPDYFLKAAKRVLEVMPRVKFVMAGSGDLTRQAVALAAEMGIAENVVFTGFLSGPEVERAFAMADLYVMPSVSEPFGIAPLEAMAHDVPVLVSKQSGVSEVLEHVLKVDFWDTDEMANQIVAVLRHAPLANALRAGGGPEARRLTWTAAARTCVKVYEQAIGMVAGLE